MSVKAKFRCNEVKDHPEYGSRTVNMSAVIGFDENGNRIDENESWANATPSGNFWMNVTNPDAFNQFEVGQDYYLTIEKVVK